MSELEKGVESGVKADFSQVPMPPDGAEGEPNEASGRADPSSTQAEVAILEFEDPASMVKEEPIEHPFRWKGEWLRKVAIRRLTFAQAMSVNEQAQKAGRELKSIDLYAAMTGLTAPVIRGMEATDADRVTKACLPFLPLTEEERASP